ncbi:MAG: ABC transporter permease [Streptomycetaceae bacterium]|nr:MAG: ABC transporter permease [Streptomycetaceae bacterium]
MKLKKLLLRNETALIIAIVLLSLIIGVKSPEFFTLANLFDIFRSSFVQLLFALGVLIVIISGGIDVSFPAVGIFAGYSAVVLMQHFEWNPENLLLPIALAIVIGTILGAINSIAIAGFGIPTLIATLGTSGIFRGLMLTFIGSSFISDIPVALDKFATADLLKIQPEEGTLARLHILIIPITVITILVSLLLTKTMFGRSVYALGGGIEATRRLGISIKRTQAKIYMLVGGLSGLAGILYVSLQRKANPYDLTGSELDIIAAVVLGGASIMGGYGTVFGTVLGVLLISLIKGNLILLGVSGSWQRAAVGTLLVIGITIQALNESKKAKNRRVSTSDEAAE